MPTDVPVPTTRRAAGPARPSGTALAYRRHKLGSEDARPRILSEYHGADGWFAAGSERLDETAARRLLSIGVSQVRVRRGLRHVEVSLRRYLGGA